MSDDRATPAAEEARRPIPGRTIRVECPRCRAFAVLNWLRSSRRPMTIIVAVRAPGGEPGAVYFRCPRCRYHVCLGRSPRTA